MKNLESASGNEKYEYCRRRCLLCSPGGATTTINEWGWRGNKTRSSFLSLYPKRNILGSEEIWVQNDLIRPSVQNTFCLQPPPTHDFKSQTLYCFCDRNIYIYILFVCICSLVLSGCCSILKKQNFFAVIHFHLIFLLLLVYCDGHCNYHHEWR